MSFCTLSNEEGAIWKKFEKHWCRSLQGLYKFIIEGLI